MFMAQRPFWPLRAVLLGLIAGLFCAATEPAAAGPTPPPPAADGARLYAQHCAACHGNQGSGGVGVPLRLPDFLAQVDDSYLRQTIRLGRPGRVMPAFRQLSNSEVEALVRHLRSWQRGPAKPLPAVGPGDPARGKALYDRHCAACHGANGEGGHGTGVTFSRPRELPILAPALNNPGFLAAASDALIKATLMYGSEGTPMRSFLAQGLHERDLDDLVAFVRRFERQPLSPPRPDRRGIPPVIERESPYGVAETVEKLKTAFNAANMRVVRVEYFGERFAERPEQVDKRRQFVDGCDFAFVNRALAIDPRIGIFLPCRVTVAEIDGKVKVMAMNPKYLSTLFNNHELDELCEKMSEVYLAVIEEATL
jgi:cytochrome c oxidase cbb3-type subunit 3